MGIRPIIDLADPQVHNWFHVVLTFVGYGFFRGLEELIVRIIANIRRNKGA